MRLDSQASLALKVARWRKAGLKIAWSNGVFDLLHIGHLATLAFAKKNCDRLIVGVDDDASAAALKGPGRPIRSARDRALLIRALRPVDAVIVFETAWLDALIAGIAPEVLVKGAEYSGLTVAGAEHADHLLFAPMVGGVSSTLIIERAACATSSPAGEVLSAATSSAPSSSSTPAQSRWSTS